MKFINHLIYLLLSRIISFYQYIISPILPARCRYYPTCSQYGQQALLWHGVWRGGWLTLKRISRCHPLGGHGVDFVPLPLYRYQFTYIGMRGQMNSQSVVGFGVYRDTNSYVSCLNHLMSS